MSRKTCQRGRFSLTRFYVNLHDMENRPRCHARRCLEFPGDIDLGDFVIVEYSGTIDTAHDNTVTGAFSIAEAIFADPAAQAPKNGAEAPEETVVAVTRNPE